MDLWVVYNEDTELEYVSDRPSECEDYVNEESDSEQTLYICKAHMDLREVLRNMKDDVIFTTTDGVEFSIYEIMETIEAEMH